VLKNLDVDTADPPGNSQGTRSRILLASQKSPAQLRRRRPGKACSGEKRRDQDAGAKKRLARPDRNRPQRRDGSRHRRKKTKSQRVIQILCRRTKNNPVLLGEAGVRKTAIVEGLAQEIAGGNVPELLPINASSPWTSR